MLAAHDASCMTGTGFASAAHMHPSAFHATMPRCQHELFREYLSVFVFACVFWGLYMAWLEGFGTEALLVNRSVL